MERSPASNRSAAPAEELRERAALVEKLERDVDALRAESAVRDAYVAELLSRLAETEERMRAAERVAGVARERLARIATDAYVAGTTNEEAIRARVAAAILRVSELKDRERAQALRAFFALRGS